MTGTYEIIYADPPWRYSAKKVQGAAENHYPTMSIDELCALPVAELAAKDSALFMWATFPQLPEALRLIRAWGFTYKSVAFVWLKKNKRRIAGFMGWASGRGPMPRSACWRPRDTPSGRPPTSTSLSFPPSRPTAKSRTKRGIRSLPSWATGPAWSCSHGRPLPAGTCGATRWSRQRASGHGGQKIAERRMFLALCECSQRSFQDQDENCL